MRDDQVTSMLDGFVNYFFGTVQTDQCLCDFHIAGTGNQAGVVITLLTA